METLFIKDTIEYDGTQLSSHYAYKNFGLAGDSIVAFIGSIYLRTDGGANTSIYVKESGTGNTGWVAK